MIQTLLLFVFGYIILEMTLLITLGRALGLFWTLALVLGAVFYGLNNSSTGNQASTTPTTQTAQQTAPANPAAPPGMRDVTPRNNAQPGMTTGAAPSKPAAPAPDMPAAKPDPAPPSDGAK